MNVKNIIKVVALAMLMPAMLLNSACSNEDEPVIDNENAPTRGYPLYVSVKATRQGDAGTNRASFDGTYLHFSEGDKLFVNGVYATSNNHFAGLLDYNALSGKFSGIIYTEYPISNTAQEFLELEHTSSTAYLIPNGYGKYFDLGNYYGNRYNDNITFEYRYAFAETKAAGVEQLSYEQGGYDKTNKRFVLNPFNAIINFTITGLAASTPVEMVFNDGTTEVNHLISTNASCIATFAIGVPGYVEKHSAGTNLNTCTLSVGGNAITLVSSSKVLTAGKIYNITRNAIPGALIGQFSVSSTKKVYFSKGNLQATYDGTNWTWAFAANQWDYIGNAAGNTMVTATSPFISGNATVDLFGWVGASSNWAGVNQYGITSSSATNNTNGYGNVASESLKSDWGTLIGSGWRTLSMAEWTYLLATRTVNGGKGADKSYTLNQSVNGKKGMVIYPDNYTGAVYSGSNWASFEAAGCVFLPAAGWRDGTTINHSINDRGYYWSTTPSNATAAKRMFFAGGLELDGDNSRAFGFSVRLVREVE